MNDRRPTVTRRAPLRSLEQDVLTAHVVLGAVLAGRTTDAHVARAFRRAAESARTAVWGAICPPCGEQLGARVWVTYKGVAYRVRQATAEMLPGARAYCTEHCAVASILREGYSFVADARRVACPRCGSLKPWDCQCVREGRRS